MHLVMLAYPGYTLRGIERELSWREIEELIGQWDTTPPLFVETQRVSSMLQKRWGAKFVKHRAKPLSGEDLLSRLASEGYL